MPRPFEPDPKYFQFGDYATMSERERNMIWKLFTSPFMRREGKEWKELARVYLGQFRAGFGRFSEDPWWVEQIAELSRLSPEFRELWTRHDILNVSEGGKTMHHPVAGELSFDFLWLKTVFSDDLRLLIHMLRSNSGTAEKMERLLAGESERNRQNPRRDLAS